MEHACGMASLQMGEYVSNVSHGIDTYSIREPLGVCAGICPFNFPAMIPLWVSLLFFIVHCYSNAYNVSCRYILNFLCEKLAAMKYVYPPKITLELFSSFRTDIITLISFAFSHDNRLTHKYLYHGMILCRCFQLLLHVGIPLS